MNYKVAPLFIIAFTTIALLPLNSSYSSQGAIPGEKKKKQAEIPCPGEKTMAGLSSVTCMKYTAVNYDEIENLPSSDFRAQEACCEKAKEALMKTPYFCYSAEIEDSYTHTTFECGSSRSRETACIFDEDLFNAIIAEHEEPVDCIQSNHWEPYRRATGCEIRRKKYVDFAPGQIITCKEIQLQ